jgi:hypothetical protein
LGTSLADKPKEASGGRSVAMTAQILMAMWNSQLSNIWPNAGIEKACEPIKSPCQFEEMSLGVNRLIEKVTIKGL